MTRAFFSSYMVVACALSPTTSAVAQDWPQWRGAGREAKLQGFAPPQQWPAQLTRKWTTAVGEGDATPALADGRLYVFTRQGDEEITRCLDSATGEELWRAARPAAAVTGAARSHSGPRSSPAVAGGKVVTLGVGGVLSCLDARNGKVVWRNEAFANEYPLYFTAMSPLILDGVCIAHLGGKDRGEVIAFDLATGEAQWKWTGDGPSYASPVLMEAGGAQQLVVETIQNIVGLSMHDGALLWQVPYPESQRSTNSSSPVIDGDTVIYSAAGRGTRAVKIAKDGNKFRVRPLWSNEELSSGFATPVLKDGVLYGLSDRGNFFCMDAATGKTNWTDEARHQRFGAIIDAGPVIAALPSDGELYVFNTSTAQYKEAAHYKVSDTPVYAHPIISGRRVFVKDKDAVSMWTIE